MHGRSHLFQVTTNTVTSRNIDRKLCACPGTLRHTWPRKKFKATTEHEAYLSRLQLHLLQTENLFSGDVCHIDVSSVLVDATNGDLKQRIEGPDKQTVEEGWIIALFMPTMGSSVVASYRLEAGPTRQGTSWDKVPVPCSRYRLVNSSTSSGTLEGNAEKRPTCFVLILSFRYSTPAHVRTC